MEWRMFFMRISLWYKRIPLETKLVTALLLWIFIVSQGSYWIGYWQGEKNALQLLNWK